jgi:NADH-quinone oxidoreductase subunit L
MPITFWTSAVAWLAISGVPPFSGFFSKDQILTAAYEHGFTAVWAIGLLTAVLTAFYMSRWFFLVFLGKPRWKAGESVIDHGHATTLHPHESPASMTVPLVVLGVLSAIGGAVLNFTHHGPFWTWLQPAVADTSDVAFAAHGPLTEPMLIGISIVAAVTGIAIAWLLYGPQRDLSSGRLAEPIRGPVAELMERKFFVDEAYAGRVRPLRWLGVRPPGRVRPSRHRRCRQRGRRAGHGHGSLARRPPGRPGARAPRGPGRGVGRHRGCRPGAGEVRSWTTS